MSAVPEISVVIPSWNTREYLAECLRTLGAADKPSTEVIVIENASADGSAEFVAEHHPEVQLVRNAINEGFARGSNQGMRLARGRYVLLLNTDTEMYPDALRRLYDFLEQNPAYGAVAPRLVHRDGRTQKTVQDFPTLWTALFFSTPLERWFPNSPELRRYYITGWEQEDSRDVAQPPAACLLVRRAVLDQIGLFDEDLWLLYNDVDFSKRMQAAGWKTRYLAEAKVVHHVGGSTSKFAEFVTTWQKDRLRYYRKHHGRFGAWWLKGCVTFTFADWILRQWGKRRRGEPFELVRPMLAYYRKFLWM